MRSMPVEHFAKACCGILLHRRQVMGIEIQRRSDVRMAQPLLHDMGLYARGEQERGARVA